MEGAATARLSVVITTHNRVELVERALASVLAATPRPHDVVIVDDGSAPAAAAALDLLAGPSVTVVHQPDSGLSVARERGVATSAGDWITFLDDDDEWLPGWMPTIGPHLGRAGVGIVTGGARFVTTEGQVTGEELPHPLGPVFGDVTAQYLAGCFAVRREVYVGSGGYLAGLTGSHQTELFIRMVVTCGELGLEVVDEQVAVAAIERRNAVERTLSNPELLFDATRWILARHADRFRSDPRSRSNWEAIAALNAVRLGRSTDARRHALHALGARPTDARAWARVAVVHTPLARRRWASAADFVAPSVSQRNPLARAAALRGEPSDEPGAFVDHLFLPWRYRQNPASSGGGRGSTSGEGGRAVRRRIAQVVRRSGSARIAVASVGGDGLVRVAAGPAGRPPTLVAGDAVLERASDPFVALEHLQASAEPGGRLVLGVRLRRRTSSHLGPPTARHLRREWTLDELRLVVEAAGMDLVWVHRVRGGAVIELSVPTLPVEHDTGDHVGVGSGRSHVQGHQTSTVVRGRS